MARLYCLLEALYHRHRNTERAHTAPEWLAFAEEESMRPGTHRPDMLKS